MHVKPPQDASNCHTRCRTYRLLIISSNHMPLCSIQTMIRPNSSLVVSFWKALFQHTHITEPLWPSRVWFSERLPPGGPPSFLPFISLPVPPSNRRTFMRAADGYSVTNEHRTKLRSRMLTLTLSKPVSPPHAIQPWSVFHDKHFNFTLFGIAIFLLHDRTRRG